MRVHHVWSVFLYRPSGVEVHGSYPDDGTSKDVGDPSDLRCTLLNGRRGNQIIDSRHEASPHPRGRNSLMGL